MAAPHIETAPPSKAARSFPQTAVRAAVRRGILEESLVLGGMTSGVTSIADIEASLEGLYFYSDLCDGDDPILRKRSGGSPSIHAVQEEGLKKG